IDVGLRRQQQRHFGECNLDRLNVVEPTNRITSEGGTVEKWDTNQQQFQCAGVAAIRRTIEPNSEVQPNYQPAPMLIYIEKGRGLLGVVIPGCAETYESQSHQQNKGQRASQGQSQREEQDQHQRVHRIREGDILAIPAGVVHWIYNDGDQQLVAFAVVNQNNKANQLDEEYRPFLLAGGQPDEHGQQGQGQKGQKQQQQAHSHGKGQKQQQQAESQNIFSGFDVELLAEAYNIPVDIVRRQQQQDKRGNLVKLEQQQIKIIRAEQRAQEWERQERQERESEQERERQRRQGGRGRDVNGFEETICSLRLRENMTTRSQSDIVSRQAGRINIVNQQKLPVLRYLNMSAERGHLFPDALYVPHWAQNNHRVIYVIRGNAQVQISDDNGNNVFDREIRQGNVFTIPQFFAAISRAGSEGFEYVSIKTAGNPNKSTLAGRTSVIRAIPADVLANSFQISPEEAQRLKHNRGKQTLVLSSSRISERKRRSESEGRAEA
uniref:11S globulin 3 n=1 Tax=Corylus avellana TaxID=13451 RepID=UPI0031F5DB05